MSRYLPGPGASALLSFLLCAGTSLGQTPEDAIAKYLLKEFGKPPSQSVAIGRVQVTAGLPVAEFPDGVVYAASLGSDCLPTDSAIGPTLAIIVGVGMAAQWVA